MQILRDSEGQPFVALDHTNHPADEVINLAVKNEAFYPEDGQIWYRVRFPGRGVSSFSALGLGDRLGKQLAI